MMNKEQVKMMIKSVRTDLELFKASGQTYLLERIESKSSPFPWITNSILLSNPSIILAALKICSKSYAIEKPPEYNTTNFRLRLSSLLNLLGLKTSKSTPPLTTWILLSSTPYLDKVLIYPGLIGVAALTFEKKL